MYEVKSEIEFMTVPPRTSRGKGVHKRDRDYADIPTSLVGNEEMEDMESLGYSAIVKGNLRCTQFLQNAPYGLYYNSVIVKFGKVIHNQKSST